MRTQRWIIALLATLSIVAVACGGDGDDPPAGGGGEDTGAERRRVFEAIEVVMA